MKLKVALIVILAIGVGVFDVLRKNKRASEFNKTRRVA
jgi:hypothetical protein